MIYMLDTANVASIAHMIESYPVDGVTTNPTIVSKERTPFGELVKSIRRTIGPERMMHVQTLGRTAEEIVREGVALNEYLGGELYIKVPTSVEGVRAMTVLKKRGLKVTATAIFTQQQALICARAGADYVAPYVNRLDNISSDGAAVVGDILQLISCYDLPCRVLAASFKNVEQVHRVSLAGVHSVTLSPELMEGLLYHPLTDQSILLFEKDWASVYGADANLIDQLK